jgi:CRISPR-associated protein Csm1
MNMTNTENTKTQVWQAALAGLLFAPVRDSLIGSKLPEIAVDAAKSIPREVVELSERLSVCEPVSARKEQFNLQERLAIIFDRIQIDNETGTLKHDLPVGQLNLEDGNIFADQEVSDGDLTNGRKAILDKLNGAVHQDISDIESYLENLLLAMQQSLWCVPSAQYSGNSDISMYDHSRITAALAVCLSSMPANDARQLLEAVERSLNQQSAKDDSETLNREVALLVGGDISGIQNFIYTISSRGAASALRGRSLYLQLLTEAIARFVLRRLNLPITNLMQASGGHFYILARARDGEQLQEIQRDISRVLLAFHRGDLYLALERVALRALDFKGAMLSTKWQELSNSLRAAKMRKFSEMQDEMYARVFDTTRRDADYGECNVCGLEHTDVQTIDGVQKCLPCRKLEELGDDLRKARYLRLSEIDFAGYDPLNAPGDWDHALQCFGMSAKLYCVDDDIHPDKNAIRTIVLALDDVLLGSTDAPKPASKVAVGRRYLVNVTPQLDDPKELERLRDAGVQDLPTRLPAVKSFSALEQDADSGFKRLGVLRMDVDDMGRMFSQGLGEHANLTRLATLSFMVNLFFEGWTAKLARKYNRPESKADRIYSIYGGGDDLFFVGSWDVMPKLAREIYNDFRRFVGNHPNIHLSAGIALISGKYPLYQAAEDAKRALEHAKNNAGKNSITFLNQTVRWDTFAEVEMQKELLQTLIEKNCAPRAVAQKLQQFQLLYQARKEELQRRGEGENQAGEEQTLWGPWNWRAAYYLARQVERNKDAKDEIENLRKSLSGDNFRAIEWIGLAARWADLKTRNSKKGEAV